MEIRGLTQFSLLDYPGRLACVIFCGGCNFRCGYCQNPYLVLYPETQPLIAEEAIIEFLASRQGKLDGVVISGGEPTTRKALSEFMATIKEMGFLVRLDTNGSAPEMIESTHQRGLLDSLGVDYKAPLARYNEIAVCKTPELGQKVQRTLSYAVSNGIDLDVRTTVHKFLLSLEDLQTMRRELDEIGVTTWHLQQFHKVELIDESLLERETYSDAELKEIAESLGPHTHARGVK